MPYKALLLSFILQVKKDPFLLKTYLNVNLRGSALLRQIDSNRGSVAGDNYSHGQTGKAVRAHINLQYYSLCCLFDIIKANDLLLYAGTVELQQCIYFLLRSLFNKAIRYAYI